MKKLFTLLLTFLLLLSLLTACGGSSAETVTEEEQLARTGITLLAPDGAEDVIWQVLTKKGTELPQITFTYEGIEYCYRAEKTDKTAPYQLSDIDYDYEWTGEGTYGDFDRISAGGEKGSWCAWLDSANGIAYEVFTYGADEEIDFLAGILCYPPEDLGDGEWTETILTGAQLIPCYTWKYDNYDAYVHVFSNHTYAFYDANKACDGVVRFWSYLENDENSIVLYNEFGGEDGILSFVGEDSETGTVTDEAGDTMRLYKGVMNGTYSCYMNEGYLDGDSLTLTAQMPYWISTWDVEQLKVGDSINNTDYDFMATEVEVLVKKSDTLYLLNDMELRYDASAKAWLLAEDTSSMEQVGVCTINDTTVFKDALDDGAHNSLAECMTAHSDGIYADVTVKSGVAESITVQSAF